LPQHADSGSHRADPRAPAGGDRVHRRAREDRQGVRPLQDRLLAQRRGGGCSLARGRTRRHRRGGRATSAPGATDDRDPTGGDGRPAGLHPRSAMIASLIVGIARLLSGAQARWIGCEPSFRQRIYFANHTSHLDFVVLWSALPPILRKLTRPVAGRDYWEPNAFKRYLATQVFQAVLVDRHGSGGGAGDDRAARV